MMNALIHLPWLILAVFVFYRIGTRRHWDGSRMSDAWRKQTARFR